MLLAQNPHPPHLMPPNISHRRHPSAPPAVVVQATKTPGLLFISKQPSRASTPRNHHQQPSHSHLQKQNRPPKVKYIAPQSQARTRTPQPHFPEARPNDVFTKPSPPKVLCDTQVNVENKPPILHPATHSPDKSPRGRRRHIPQQVSTPTPATRPIPVPRPIPHSRRTNVSRSAPTQSSVPFLLTQRPSTVCPSDFPVCDDTTDVDDTSPPSTPTRQKPAATWQQLASKEAPRTAPLNTTVGFAFGSHLSYNTPSPPRRHYRTPSEGVFHMSFDEDMSSTSDASEEHRKLFGLMPRKYGSLGHSATRSGKDKAGFFASSVFQNSPSPDELPPPAF